LKPDTIIIVATVASHLRNFHLPWVRHLRAAGFKVIGGACDIQECADCRAVFDETVTLPFSRSMFSWRQAFQAGRELRRLVVRSGAILVHVHTPNAAFWGRLGLARVQTLKVAYTAHGFHFHQGGLGLANRIYRAAEQWAARFTDALITINQEDYLAAKDFRLRPGGRVEIIPGIGLDFARFQPQSATVRGVEGALRDSWKLPAGVPLVLMVAEFIPRKRHRDFLMAMARCENRRFHAVFAGDGIGLDSAKLLSQQLGLSDRVRYLGFRRDVPELLAAADLLVLPCEREGLPVCVMEALAMNKPVIGANARGTRDLLAPDCGWLHEVGDVKMLAEQIDYVLSHPDEARQRAGQGRKRILAEYGWEPVRDKLIDIYRRLGIMVKS